MSSISATIVYASQDEASDLSKTPVPIMQHLAGLSGRPSVRTPSLAVYSYPAAKSHLFATPFTADFSYSLESLSHSRNLSFIKPLVGGPHFDLEAIWDEHTWYEFGDRSVEHTMSTMVKEPYVNHVTTVSIMSLKLLPKRRRGLPVLTFSLADWWHRSPKSHELLQRPLHF